MVEGTEAAESHQIFPWLRAVTTSDDGKIGVRPEVQYAQVAHRVHALFVPNDPMYLTQQWNLPLINIEKAWDIQPQAGGFYFSPSNLTNANGTLYFAANDPLNGQQLWKTDGTTAGTVLVSYSSSLPANLTNVNGTLFYAALDAVHNTELWKSDGTQAGTVMVKDIDGANSSFPSDYPAIIRWGTQAPSRDSGRDLRPSSRAPSRTGTDARAAR